MIRVSANTYSKSKYASVIREVGGWEYFQKLLTALDGIARKHSVDIATVSSRWVLDQPQVRPCMHLLACVALLAKVCSVRVFMTTNGDRYMLESVALLGAKNARIIIPHANGALTCWPSLGRQVRLITRHDKCCLLLWLQVAGVIVGARNAMHVQQHQKLFSFSLDAEDRQRIEDISAQGVRPSSDCYTWERGGSFA